jgi:hypothetical protein
LHGSRTPNTYWKLVTPLGVWARPEEALGQMPAFQRDHFVIRICLLAGMVLTLLWACALAFGLSQLLNLLL